MYLHPRPAEPWLICNESSVAHAAQRPHLHLPSSEELTLMLMIFSSALMLQKVLPAEVYAVTSREGCALCLTLLPQRSIALCESIAHCQVAIEMDISFPLPATQAGMVRSGSSGNQQCAHQRGKVLTPLIWRL